MSLQSQQQIGGETNDDRTLTILEHLQELRRCVAVCGMALVVTMIASFSFAGAGIAIVVLALMGIARVPGKTKWLMLLAILGLAVLGVYSYTLVPEFWNTAATTETLNWLKAPAEKHVDNFELVFTDPLEFWSTYFRVSLLLGITLAMPVFLWEALAFVGPGLTRSEKRWAYPIIFAASSMFVLGGLFAYYVEMPPAIHFLLSPPSDIARPLISVQKYIGFATKLMLVTGLVFETPWVIMGLAKIGLVNSRGLLKWWRFSIIGAFLLSAVVTPSIDPITQTLVAAPMIVLYFVGIALAKLVEKSPLIPRA